MHTDDIIFHGENGSTYTIPAPGDDFHLFTENGKHELHILGFF